MTQQQSRGTQSWPSGWRDPRSGPGIVSLAPGILLAIGLVIVSDVSAISLMRLSGFNLTSVLLLSLVIPIGSITADTIIARLRCRSRDVVEIAPLGRESDEPAMSFPRSARNTTPTRIAVISNAVTAYVILVVAVLELPIATATRFEVLVPAAAALVIISIRVDGRLRRRHTMPGDELFLTPTQICVRRGRVDIVISWEIVRCIRSTRGSNFPIAIETPTPAIWHYHRRNGTVKPLPSRVRVVRYRAAAAALDPRIVHAALTCYLHQPDLREELGIQAGIDRVQSGHFEPSLSADPAEPGRVRQGLGPPPRPTTTHTGELRDH